MNKKHYLVAAVALAAVLLVYFFAPTVDKSKKVVAGPQAAPTHTQVDVAAIEQAAIEALPAEAKAVAKNLSNSLKSASSKADSLKAVQELAKFWRTATTNPFLHLRYQSSLAELENNEKSLTFAGHSILEYLPYAENTQQQSWLAHAGAHLFDKALALNPKNDSSVVGRGGMVMFGGGDGANTMEGIMKVREVAERDSTNLFAQYMLGVGGMLSGQFDKAAARFEKVAQKLPGNVEMKFKAAEAWEQAGETDKAITWYQNILHHIDQPDLQKAVQQRIEELKKNNVKQ